MGGQLDTWPRTVLLATHLLLQAKTGTKSNYIPCIGFHDRENVCH